MSEEKRKLIYELENIIKSATLDARRPFRFDFDPLFHTLSGQYIPSSFSMFKAFERAYDDDKKAFKKALIAVIEKGNKYLQAEIEASPSLKEDFLQKIQKNKESIEKIKGLL